MNFTLHNKIEITLNNKTKTFYNTLLSTVYSKISNLEEFTSHLAIGTGTTNLTPSDSHLGCYLKTFETETEQIQSDVSKGTLFLKKVVDISEDMPDQFTFSELGLTSSNEFDPIIYNHVLLTDSEGNVTNITRNIGDSMQIRVTIYLELTPASQALFISGENNLIKQILGENLNILDNRLYCMRGNNLFPNTTINRVTPQIENAVPCTSSMVIGSNQGVTITFSCELGNGQTEEILFIYGNQACLRLNTQLIREPVLSNNIFSINLSNNIDLGPNINEIHSVVGCVSNQEEDYTLIRYSKKLADKISNPFDISITASTPRFISKDGSTIAFLLDSTLHFYRCENYSFKKLNSSQVVAGNLFKLIIVDDRVVALYTTPPYIRIYEIIEENIIQQEINLTNYNVSVFPYSWIDADATITLRGKLRVGLIINNDDKTPIILEFSKNNQGVYNDFILRPTLGTAKAVYAIYNTVKQEPLIGFITDTYEGMTNYFIEEYIEDEDQFNESMEAPFALLNSSQSIFTTGNLVVSKKTQAPYIKICYYPNFEITPNSFSSGIDHYISKTGKYLIAKYANSSYKIFDIHNINTLDEFDDGFPEFVNENNVVDFEFVSDILLVFTSTQESVYGIAIKNNLATIYTPNVNNETNFNISYSEYDLLGSQPLEGVKAKLSLNFNPEEN